MSATSSGVAVRTVMSPCNMAGERRRNVGHCRGLSISPHGRRSARARRRRAGPAADTATVPSDSTPPPVGHVGGLCSGGSRCRPNARGSSPSAIRSSHDAGSPQACVLERRRRGAVVVNAEAQAPAPTTRTPRSRSEPRRRPAHGSSRLRSQVRVVTRRGCARGPDSPAFRNHTAEPATPIRKTTPAWRRSEPPSSCRLPHDLHHDRPRVPTRRCRRCRRARRPGPGSRPRALPAPSCPARSSQGRIRSPGKTSARRSPSLSRAQPNTVTASPEDAVEAEMTEVEPSA